MMEMEPSHEENEVIDLLLARRGRVVNKEIDGYIAYARVQQYRHSCGCVDNDFLSIVCKRIFEWSAWEVVV